MSRFRLSFPALILAGLLPAALPADPAKPAGPSPKILKDLVYKTVNGKDLKLDLYLPVNAPAPMPLMLVVHGGGWTAGTKADSGGMALQFAGHGYAAAAIDYRLKQEAVFPAQIEDVKAAVRWLRAHADDYHLDPDRFGAAGHSAGGHLVSLLGTSGEIPQFDTGDNLKYSSKVKAVVDLAGIVDLAAYFKFKGIKPETPIALLGGSIEQKKDLAILGSPIDHITPNTPPFLLISGLNDTMVGVEAPRSMYAALQKAHIPSQLILLPNMGHGIILTTPYQGGTVWNAIFHFLDPILKPSTDSPI